MNEKPNEKKKPGLLNHNPVNLLAREINWDKFRLNGIRNQVKHLAIKYGVQIPEEQLGFLDLIEVNINRVHKQSKAKILGIPEHKVTFRKKEPKKDENGSASTV